MRKIITLISILISTCGVAQQFSPEIELTTSAIAPSDAYAADLDGDGDLDVVSAIGHSIIWFEHTSEDIFAAKHVITNDARGSKSVYVIDLDNDGDVDVLSASSYDDKIAWYENLGGGLFGSQNVISLEADYAEYVYAIDLDNDGDADVLSASRSDNKIAWYENLGNGLFGSQNVISTNTLGANSTFAADLDGDGDADVLSTSWYGDKIAWHENLGDGLFGSQNVLSSEALSAKSVHAADLDGDGDLDVLSASKQDHKLAWYENLGNGLFGAQQIIALPYGVLSVKAGDFDGDGDLDIVSAGSSQVTFYENQGGAVFSAPQDIDNGDVRPVKLQVVDLEGNGSLDIVVTSQVTDEIIIYKNLGGNQFSAEMIVNVQAESVYSVYAADIDADGDIDVLSASPNDSKIAWYENVGGGGFNPQYVIGGQTLGARSVRATDLDDDGDLDILFAAFNNGTGWYENLGGGIFGTQQVISTENAWKVHSVDLDEDGDMDVLSCSWTENNISWYENQGGGIFSEQQVISTQTDGAQSVYSADLDGDGDMDILSASEYDHKIAWYENQGGGQIGPQQIISTIAIDAFCVFASDLDGDGDIDVLSASGFYDHKVAWYENEGSGVFGQQQIISTDPNSPRSVRAADIDGDGDMDVISASSSDDKIAWFENLGNANFTQIKTISDNADNVGSIFIADLDADGDPDVLSASHADDKIAWYENKLGQGCTDPSACNYDPDSWLDNGDCCYDNCGCTFSGADNYNPLATCNDGTCEFQISGLVFFDENENGVMEQGEYGLPFQQLGLFPDSLTLTTNDNGEFLVSNLGSEPSYLSLEENVLFPYFTTPQSLIFDVSQENWSQLYSFGVSNEAIDFAIDVNLYPEGNDYLCDTISQQNICFRNMGNVPINGVIEFEYDSLFQGCIEMTPIDSIGGDTIVYLSFENLLPGELYVYDVGLHTPAAVFLGEYLTNVVRIYGSYEGEQVAYGEEILVLELTCAYDPNDKQVFPNGYTDAHYVPEDEYLEYLVRFQNTGNAPATDVIIRDTIDDGLDISTFELVANSHSVFTTVDPESREVEFYFQDIQLPDSVNNETESHGLVSFRVRPEEGLPLLTELNNTAYIFFDNNPPIVTNTTWSTTYNCSLFEVNFTQDGAILTASEGDGYQWYLGGEPIEGATAPIFEAFVNGEYAVEVNSDFPCSELTESVFILVDGLEELNGSPVSFFPNPMTQRAVIDLGDVRGQAQVEVYDLSGKLMRSENVTVEGGVLSLERGELASGSYLLRVIVGGESIEVSFVVE